ncbi:hypothetical protein HR060_16365 [Catenovulum sp. SM1970]|uniref:hypothetical protein n=1 Tax=Marinifaba aquimaris TaxID=2741323 RepID=UPI0015746FAC|nr:hypothetical protein [Marinifaba aquimaris]NTS78424.1 hypothetical protein [Marinifaba aquimaris]
MRKIDNFCTLYDIQNAGMNSMTWPLQNQFEYMVIAIVLVSFPVFYLVYKMRGSNLPWSGLPIFCLMFWGVNFAIYFDSIPRPKANFQLILDKLNAGEYKMVAGSVKHIVLGGRYTEFIIDQTQLYYGDGDPKQGLINRHLGLKPLTVGQNIKVQYVQDVYVDSLGKLDNSVTPSPLSIIITKLETEC